jgi:hypothetical protein
MRKGKARSKMTFPVWAWIAVAVGFIAIVGAVILLSSRPSVATLPTEISVAQAAQKRA